MGGLHVGITTDLDDPGPPTRALPWTHWGPLVVPRLLVDLAYT